jgi:hypothetical protein
MKSMNGDSDIKHAKLNDNPVKFHLGYTWLEVYPGKCYPKFSWHLVVTPGGHQDSKV